MTLDDMKLNKKYEICNLCKLSSAEQKNLYELGLCPGEIISKDNNIQTVQKICMFRFGNSQYCINKSYASKIEVKEIKK